MDDLLVWRKEFPTLETTIHMISHSLGAMPRRVHERLREYADTWSSRGIRAWEEGWWEMPVTVGDLVGRLIGAGPSEVVMQQNVSTCIATVLSCFDWSGPRNKIVSEAANFPSNLYQCHALEKLGARVVTVDDVATTGTSVSHAIQAIRANGGIVDDVVALVSRQEGAEEHLKKMNVRLTAVATVKDIVNTLHKAGLIDDNTMESVMKQMASQADYDNE